MRGDQARKVCPEVQLVQVPTAHGKADLTLYRDAGKQVCAPLKALLLNSPRTKQVRLSCIKMCMLALSLIVHISPGIHHWSCISHQTDMTRALLPCS